MSGISTNIAYIWRMNFFFKETNCSYDLITTRWCDQWKGENKTRTCLKLYTYAIPATMLQLYHCNYCATMLQLPCYYVVTIVSPCSNYCVITWATICWHGNDVLTNYPWTCDDSKYILIFNILIYLIYIIKLRSDKMLTHGVYVNE
jgi:hypothetical protein